MKDSKLKLHVSLASRIVWIVALLLVMPLCIQTALLYKQEYFQKRAAVQAMLRLVALERIEKIRALPSSDWTAVDPAAPYPIQFAIAEKGVPPNTLVVEEPIPNSLLHLAVYLPESFVKTWHQSEFFHRMSLLFVCVFGIGGSAVYFLTRRVSRPMRHLSATFERVSEGAIHARYTPDWMGFEINQLGKQFNQTMDLMLQHQKSAEKERVLRERLAEELRIGHDIQKGLLPTQIPLDVGLDIAPGYLPAKEVSGDFYDFFVLPDGKLLLLVVDVAGKGVSACLHALGLRSVIQTLAEMGRGLEEIVLKANDLFWRDAKNSGMFATLWIGEYEPKSKRLCYCSQGHPAAVLVRRGEVIELSTKGISLGAQQIDAVQIGEQILESSDLLCIYTDGVTEAHDVDNQLFGKKRFLEILIRKKKESPEQIVTFLLEEVELFAQGTVQHDDMTLLICRCK